MFIKSFLIACAILFFTVSSFGSDILVSGVHWVRDSANSKNQITFTISWNNSWHTERNHDAAWVFIKYINASGLTGFRHAKVLPGGHSLHSNEIKNSPQPTIEVPNDSIGFFIFPSRKYRGNISWTVTISLDNRISGQINNSNWIPGVFAMEMVRIPESKFSVGEADSAAARKNFSLFSSDGKGLQEKPFEVTSENPINISPSKGDLYYHTSVPQYHGDRRGPIPASFPKGYQSFYMMKYEITQGEYANFLNAISANASYARVNFGGKDYYMHRGSIRMNNTKYAAGSPSRPNNFFSWDDAMAFADWVGLRPITELEFEKAARGLLTPVPNEYPWNTGSKENLKREVSKTTDELVLLNNLKEADLNDANRDQYGASYYWVMDLAGSLWERCVTIGDSVGRSFTGSHGDGMLSGYGDATNKDWPKGSTETAGFGFKGGGYYEHSRTFAPDNFNPQSPIGNRNFGSWAGGARSVAYGSRLARTVIPASVIELKSK